ncbi:MAG: LEA type 2 family protein [Bacteroidota bacterium]
MTKYYFLLLLLVGACSMPQEVAFKKVENLKLSGISFKNKNITLTADAVYHNPNNVSLEVKGLRAKVYIDGEEVSTVREQLSTQMPASANFSLPVSIEIPTKKVLNNLGGLLKQITSSKKTVIRMEGAINVEVLGQELAIPFDHEQLYEVEQ